MSVTVLRFTVRDLIVPFIALAIAVTIYGLVSIARALIEAILGVVASALGSLPLIGDLAESAVHKATQALTHSLGSVAAAEEEAIGRYFHALGDVIASVGDGIYEIAKALYNLSGVVLLIGTGRAIWDSVSRLQHQVQALQGELETAIRHGVNAVPKAASVSITNITRVAKVTSAALDQAITVDIPNLWDRTRADADSLARLWRWTRAHGKTIGEGLGLAAVGAALTRLGLGWLRCNNVGKAARGICRTHTGLLDDLLTGLVVVMSAASVKVFAEEMRAVEDEAVGVLRGMIREMRDL